MRLEGDNEAKESDDGSGASGVGLAGRALEGSGRVNSTSSGRSGGASGSAVAVRSLDLSVGDLGNRLLGGCSLDLSVGDLGHSGGSAGSGGAGLNLTIRDLGHRGSSGGGGAGLDLTVGDLGHRGASGGGGAGLDLTVGDLAHGSARGLKITVIRLTEQRRESPEAVRREAEKQQQWSWGWQPWHRQC
jgi:hypothetical protein